MMQTWRYKAMIIRELALSESKLNAEGEKGWELVSVLMTDDSTARFYFKQPIEAASQSRAEHAAAAHS